MMIPLSAFADIAAILSAMCDMVSLGKESFQAYLDRRRQDSSNQKNADLLQRALSTYSDAEVEAIRRRIESCRDRFIREGSGENRKACLCSVLSDVKEGNGGQIPVKEWEDVYDRLGCDLQ